MLLLNRESFKQDLWFKAEDTPPLTAEVVHWHVAVNSEQYFLVVKILVERQSEHNRLITVAALQRSRVVQDSQRGDICRRKIKVRIWKTNVVLSIVSVALTVSGDVNGPFLFGPWFKLVHTGQGLALMKVQRKPIGQPDLHCVSFMFCVHEGLTFSIFRKVPGKICLDTLPCALAHCQPETRVSLSHHRCAQQGGF